MNKLNLEHGKRTTANDNGHGNNNIQLKAILNRKIFSDHLFIDDKCMHISKNRMR